MKLETFFEKFDQFADAPGAVGKMRELVLDLAVTERLVAPESVYSIVRFDLKAQGAETLLIFEHTGFPVEHSEHLASGWQNMYWENLQKYLAYA